MNKKFGLGFLALVMLAGCGNANTGVVEESATDTDAVETAEAKTSTAEIEGDDGVKTTAEVVKEGDKVTSVTIEEYTADGLSKKELGDEYGMKAASTVEKEWYEQVEALEAFILKNGVDAVELDDNGVATNEDLKSSCTMNISTMVEAVKEAEAK